MLNQPIFNNTAYGTFLPNIITANISSCAVVTVHAFIHVCVSYVLCTYVTGPSKINYVSTKKSLS